MTCRSSRSGVWAVLHGDAQIYTVEEGREDRPVSPNAGVVMVRRLTQMCRPGERMKSRLSPIPGGAR